MSGLRRVEPPGEPLTPEALEERAAVLVRDAQIAAVDAVRLSMLSEFISMRGQKMKLSDLRRWRSTARDARSAWARVDALVSEVITEAERTAAAGRGGDGA